MVIRIFSFENLMLATLISFSVHSLIVGTASLNVNVATSLCLFEFTQWLDELDPSRHTDVDNVCCSETLLSYSSAPNSTDDFCDNKS